MDESTQKAVTAALDVSIASVAEEWFAKLSTDLSNEKVATKICRAIGSLRGLRQGCKPTYDAWDALFYAVWYQPAHINLAYTLASKAMEDIPSPHDCGLEVFDFGCGALAMQFGLALAATDALTKLGIRRQIFIVSSDDSKDMCDIGWKIWNHFVKTIANYSYLLPLYRVCSEIKLTHPPTPVGKFWLTVLHVAYKQNHDDVKKILDDRVAQHNPELIISTSHTNKMSIQWAYSPEQPLYESYKEVLNKSNLNLSDSFSKTTDFRRGLYDKWVSFLPKDLYSKGYRPDFMWENLKKHPTAWTTPSFEAQCNFYNRRQS